MVLVDHVVNKTTSMNLQKCNCHEIPLGVKDGTNDVAGPWKLHLLPTKPQKYAIDSQGQVSLPLIP